MRLFTVLSFVLLVSASCGPEELRGDLLEYQPRQFDIPAGLNNSRAYVFVLGPFSTDHARFESLTSTPWEEWNRVEPARASLSINESGLNWDFLFEVSIRAYNSDPAEAKEIFYRDLIQENTSNRLDLIPTDFDANLGLLDGEEYFLEVELTRLRRSPPQSLPVVLQYSFEGFK